VKALAFFTLFHKASMRIHTGSLNPINSFGRVTFSIAECFRRLGYKPNLTQSRDGDFFAAIDGPPSSISSAYLITFWETTKLRPIDLEYLRKQPYRKIIVTCKFTQEVFERDGFSTSLIPLAAEHKPIPLPSFETFNFYTIYQDMMFWQRKRAQDIVDAFTRAFPHEKDVRLVMKQGPHCKELITFDSRVKVIREYQSNVNYLHRENHIFVSACGAEGWGYPHHDAMAHGRPVICPAIGGPLEFLNHSCAWLIPPEMIQAPGNIYDYTGEIGKINVDDLAYAMRYAYENKAEVMEKSVNAFIRARQFTLDQMTVSVKKAFNL